MVRVAREDELENVVTKKVMKVMDMPEHVWIMQRKLQMTMDVIR